MKIDLDQDIASPAQPSPVFPIDSTKTSRPLTLLKDKVEDVTNIRGGDDAIEEHSAPVMRGYNMKVFEYIKSDRLQYKIAKSIDDARWKRAERKRFVSLREADILARGNVELVAGNMLDMMLVDGDGTYMLCEGTPGCADSGWHLRLRYNNGLAWIEERVNARNLAKRHGRDSDVCSIDFAIEKGRKSLGVIRSQLDELLIPLWDDEIDGGFMPFLLKPEFMTAEQYVSIATSKIEVDSVELNEMVNALR